MKHTASEYFHPVEQGWAASIFDGKDNWGVFGTVFTQGNNFLNPSTLEHFFLDCRIVRRRCVKAHLYHYTQYIHPVCVLWRGRAPLTFSYSKAFHTFFVHLGIPNSSI